MEQLNRLIDDYNEAENLQRERLIQLWQLIAARKGYRELRFANRTWNNCWQGERPDLILERLLDGMIFRITGCNPGTD